MEEYDSSSKLVIRKLGSKLYAFAVKNPIQLLICLGIAIIGH